MTTRRIVATEKTFLDKDDPVDETSSTAPAVPRYASSLPQTTTLATHTPLRNNLT